MSLIPPLKVEKLQTALHTKAKNSPDYRFCDFSGEKGDFPRVFIVGFLAAIVFGGLSRDDNCGGQT